jgi:hypothetical protein
MNRLRNIVGLIAVCATAAFFTGCGDDDDNNGNNNNSNVPASFAGRSYNLTDAAGTSTIAFDQNGTAYALTSSAGATETGSFTQTKSGETANFILTNAAGDRTSTLDMTFTGDGAGTYVFTPPGEAPVSGSFAAAGGGTATDGNTTTTATDGNTTTTATDGNTTTGQGTVNAPATLPSITLTPVNGIAPGQTFTVTLNNGGTFTTSRVSDGQSMGTGTYQYTPSGTTANLKLMYGAPNAGDIDDYNLVFTSAQGSGQNNNFSGTQTSGQPQPVNGTFTY